MMKELQRCVAFRCYNDILVSGTSKGAKELQSKAYTLYFGNCHDEESVGYYKQLLMGSQAFAPMYELSEDIAKGTTTKTLKKVLHCMEETIIVSSSSNDRGIDAAVLCSKGVSNKTHISARTIWDFAKTVERNGKKALALVQLSEYKNGNLPSGKAYEDYLLFVRESMYKETNGNPEYVDEEEVDDDEKSGVVETVAADELPANWFFPGFFAFALWGPFVPPGGQDKYKAEAFFIKDNNDGKGKKDGGRAAARKAQLADEAKVRSTSLTSAERGLNNDQALFVASIAQQYSTSTLHHRRKIEERDIGHYKSRIRRAERDVDRWRSLLTPDMYLNPDPTNLAVKGFQDANEKLHEAEKQLDEYMRSVKEHGANHSDRYQDIIETTLSAFLPPPDEGKSAVL